MTCIGNSGPIEENIANTIEQVNSEIDLFKNNSFSFNNLFESRTSWFVVEFYLATGTSKEEYIRIRVPIILHLRFS